MSRNKMLFQGTLLAFTLMIGTPALAQSKGGGGSSTLNFEARAQKRESSRWTLSEWLETKDRNRLMDMWLSMNSPSPFEFMVGGAYVSYLRTVDTPKSENSFTTYTGEIRAYAQFVGLTAEYTNNSQEKFNDTTGFLNIRLLGDSLQNSSLTLHAGQRTRSLDVGTDKAFIRNFVTGATLQLYMAKYFGIEGSYRNYEPVRNDTLGATVGGNRTEAGLFIDFKSVRVFGAWTLEKQFEQSDTTGASTTTREGIQSGLKIFY